jgi:hypothetical protein
MPADFSALRLGLAANLEAGLSVPVSPYVLSNPSMPIVWVRPSYDTLVTYHEAMRSGVETWSLIIQAYVGALTDSAEGQKLLDELVSSTGPGSVKLAAESDPTLGGVAANAYVTACRSYAEFTRPDGATVLGAEWLVEITT